MKKKGFTLIELLAVIVILAIIAVITIPMILGVIEKAKLGALEDTVYGLVEAGELYYTQNMFENETATDLSFTPDENQTGMYSGENKLTYKGTVPDTGSYVNVTTTGTVEVKVKSGDYCAIKYADSNSVLMYEEDCVTLLSGTTEESADTSALAALIGSETLSTSAQTVTGAINELNDKINIVGGLNVNNAEFALLEADFSSGLATFSYPDETWNMDNTIVVSIVFKRSGTDMYYYKYDASSVSSNSQVYMRTSNIYVYQSTTGVTYTSAKIMLAKIS